MTVLAAAGTIGGCTGDERGIRIVVTDHLGEPLTAEVSCLSYRVVGAPDDFIQTEVQGTVDHLGGGDYRCVLPDDPLLEGLYIDVEAEGHRLSLSSWPIDLEVLPLRLWRPEVTAEQVGDQVVVSWDAPAPVPRLSDDEGGGADPGWIVRYTAWVGDLASAQVEATASQLSIPVDHLEDAVDPELHVGSSQMERTSGTLGRELFLSLPVLSVARTPVVPLSRGAACTLVATQYDENESETEITRSYPAGECPYTDGVVGDDDCSNCSIESITVDLGVAQTIARVLARGSGANREVSISDDGVTFVPVDGHDLLDQPVTARFFRVAHQATVEVSLFAPWVSP